MQVANAAPSIGKDERTRPQLMQKWLNEHPDICSSAFSEWSQLLLLRLLAKVQQTLDRKISRWHGYCQKQKGAQVAAAPNTPFVGSVCVV